MVYKALTASVRGGERTPAYRRGMTNPFITGRAALDDAALLIDTFGEDAGLEAASRAKQSRGAGNVKRFCHWRQIERVIATLVSGEVRGTIH